MIFLVLSTFCWPANWPDIVHGAQNNQLELNAK